MGPCWEMGELPTPDRTKAVCTHFSMVSDSYQPRHGGLKWYSSAIRSNRMHTVCTADKALEVRTLTEQLGLRMSSPAPG